MNILSDINLFNSISALAIDTNVAQTTVSTIEPLTESKDISEVQVNGLIGDLALILIFGAIITLIFKKLKQPVVLGYIVAGVIAGPHFLYLPSVTNEANIEFWAQIGIVVLLFSLGLEFSFKKLMNVGGSAIITALIIVMGMMGFGFAAGKLINLSFINSLFLGAMLSMSSTTIIIKALTDLNLRQRKFVPMVFAVLICEDLFAVVMMVILSSIAINNTLEGSEMIYSILKLVFFLVIWFSVGVFILPTFFRYFRKFINEEILLITAMGLCFLMAVFSVYSGFSLALGAFVMGSILAGTCEAEHIEKVTKPVKDLFGGVFFISVGMMVDPDIIVQFIGPILLLSAVVIIGMICFGTFGMLVTGQSLKVALESGFSLTQIGEFAFIIASMGMSLGVLEPSIYPIVVAVSVITTFTTPYFIKLAEPAYFKIEKHIPARWHFLIDRYTKQAAIVDEYKSIWLAVAQRYIWRIILYSTVIIAIIALAHNYSIPFFKDWLGDFGVLCACVLTLIGMAPFLLALSNPSINKSQREKLNISSGGKSNMPLVVMSLFRIFIAFAFVIGFITSIYSFAFGITFGISIFVLLIVFFSKSVKKRLTNIESKFVKNLNERELRRSGKDNNIISDLHVAYMEVGYNCPFVGERLGNADIRKEYGVNVVSIQRGALIIPVPTSNTRVFPGDLLGVIGTDEQIDKLLHIVESEDNGIHSGNEQVDVKFTHFEITESSPLLGETTASIGLRDNYSALLVAIQRGGDNYIKPTGKEDFQIGDILWLVGDNNKIETLK
ncbi:MAG: cation:proton antiporter [Muribaculaceae bacterium]|nr:cation:proton antiporter [Muribaculaceae bacterium]